MPTPTAGLVPIGPARVDRVIFRIVPEPASRVAALLAGEVDLIDELPHHAIRQLEANPRTLTGKARRVLDQRPKQL